MKQDSGETSRSKVVPCGRSPHLAKVGLTSGRRSTLQFDIVRNRATPNRGHVVGEPLKFGFIEFERMPTAFGGSALEASLVMQECRSLAYGTVIGPTYDLRHEFFHRAAPVFPIRFQRYLSRQGGDSEASRSYCLCQKWRHLVESSI